MMLSERSFSIKLCPDKFVYVKSIPERLTLSSFAPDKFIDFKSIPVNGSFEISILSNFAK